MKLNRLFKRWLFVFGVGWQFTVQVFGQPLPENSALTLEMALQQCKTNNAQLKSEDAKVLAAKAKANQLLQYFLPQVSISETAVITNAPLNAFGFKLQREVTQQSDFNPALLNDPGKVHNYLTQLDFQLPLINTEALPLRKAASAGINAATYQKQYTSDYLQLGTKQLYYGIVLVLESKKVVEKAIEAAEKTKVLVSDYFKNGLAKNTDLLAVEVKLSELKQQKQQLIQQESSYRMQLNQLMGAPIQKVWIISDSLPKTVATPSAASSDINNRADILAWKQGLFAQSQVLLSKKAAYLPTLNAFGNYAMYSLDAFGSEGDNYLLGLQLKWDLFKGYKHQAGQKLASAEAAKLDADFLDYQQKALVELSQATESYKLELSNIQVAQAAVQQSKELLKVTTDRAAQGLEKTTDLLMAQAMYLQQELRLLQANYGANMAAAKIELLSSNGTFYPSK